MATQHAGDAAPLEKDFENGYHLDSSMDTENALKKIRTTGSLSISPELFEKIYLSPQNRVAGDLRKTFGNPTPLCLGGFLLSLSPLSCILMGWRGSGGLGASQVGVLFAFGGILMILGAVGEFILGNTFPFVVFGTFGAFWLAFAMTLQPFYNTYGFFAPAGEAPAAGLAAPTFYNSFAFFLVFMGVLCFIYMICALRTNAIFLAIFILLIPAFSVLAAAFWTMGKGYAIEDQKSAAALDLMAKANKFLIAGGALTFVVDMLGWWIFAAIMLAALDFPFQIPVGDLSHLIKGASEKAKAKEEYSA